MFIFHVLQYILTILKCIKQITYVYLKNYIYHFIKYIVQKQVLTNYYFLNISTSLTKEFSAEPCCRSRSKQNEKRSQYYCGTIFKKN